MILSVSRRTDIPAFYSEWFMKRIKEKIIGIKNPYNGNIKKINISPENIDCIVFWTKNPKNLMKYLKELDKLKYNYYFQFTLTGYNKNIETNVPDKLQLIKNFKELSDMIGKEKVIWRYDPIFLDKYYTIEKHLNIFNYISKELKNKTKRIVISFIDKYQKMNMKYEDILNNKVKLDILLSKMSEIAKMNKQEIVTCSETINLDKYNIKHGKCIDDDLIKELFKIDLSLSKDKSQRKACGCVLSIDIGAYNTCNYGCKYCYATTKPHKPDINKIYLD